MGIIVNVGIGIGDDVPVGLDVGDNIAVTVLVGTVVGTEADALGGASVPVGDTSVATCLPVEVQALAVKATNENNSKYLNIVHLLVRFPAGFLNGHLAIGSRLTG